MEYSKRLGPITPKQFQAALDHFGLGQFIRAEPIPFGLFGQNVFVTSTKGQFVLRGAAHSDWQFPKEQFVARLLHEKTSVPAPWPYLIGTDEAVFGWKYGYAILPRMPGLQLANPEVLKTITMKDRKDIAYTIGENLREVQKVEWPSSGQYDLKTKTIKAFNSGFENWLVDELRQLVQKSLSYNDKTTEADKAWIEHIIQAAEEALKEQSKSVLVLHDYKEANLTVQKQGDHWKVSGVFDLMEALIGDGEFDLVRQLADYIELDDDLALAKSFLDGYQKTAPLRPLAYPRLSLYMVYDRTVIWEYFHRPENLGNVTKWWYGELSAREWMGSYLAKLEELLQDQSASRHLS